MSTLATGFIQILPSMAGMKANLVSGMTPDANAAGGVVGKTIGKAAILGIAAAGIGAVIKKSITEGAALEQSLGGVETMYKKHADTVIKNANKAWKTAGLSANEYMETSTSFAAGLLQSVGGNTQKAAKITDMAIIDMADNANKFGTDIQRIQDAYQGFAKQNYTMLDNLKLGYGGTKSEMERLLADAEKLTGQKYDINNLSDVYTAIHVIQNELGVTGTTAEEAASTLTGSFASMQSAFKNFLGQLAIGGNIKKPMKALAISASTFLFDNLVPAILNIAKAIPNVLFSGGGLVGNIVAKLPELIKQIINSAVKILNSLATNIYNAIINFANDPSMSNSGIQIAKSIAVGLLKGIPKLLVAVLKLGTAVTRALFSVLKSKLAPIVSTFTAPFTKAKNLIKKIFPFNLGKILKLKLPKITVSGGKAPWGIGGAGKKPSFNVKWNAKAVDNPYMFSGATVFGAGETKDEVLYGRANLMRDIREASGGNIDYEKLTEVFIAALKHMTIVTTIDGKEVARTTAPEMRKEINKIDRRANRALGIV